MGYLFISYASEDFEIAQRIESAFRGLDIDVWLDKSRLHPGFNWDYKIKMAIEDSLGAIFIISSYSMSKRSFIREELEILIDRSENRLRDTGGRYLLPVRIDDVIVEEPRLAKIQTVDLRDMTKRNISSLTLKIFDIFSVLEEGEKERDIQTKSPQEVKETIKIKSEDLKSEVQAVAPNTNGKLFKHSEFDIFVNKITREVYIFHGREIITEIERLEYYPVNKTVAVVFKDGQRLDLGANIQWLVRPTFEKATEVAIVRTLDGEAIDGQIVPIVHVDEASGVVVDRPENSDSDRWRALKTICTSLDIFRPRQK